MSEPPALYTWEDYLYPPRTPDARPVLRNLLGLTGYDDLANAERALTLGRELELRWRPQLVPRTFDTAHWQGIHRQLFQDVYSWAGQWRTVDMGKVSHGFVPADQIDQLATGILDQVRAAGVFVGRDRAGVVEGLTYTLQSLNIIHPFREGNGRTQRVLTQHMAEYAGYLLNWERISPTEQNVMMSLAYDGDLAMLQSALAGAVIPIVRGGAGDHPPWPDAVKTPARAPEFWRLPQSRRSVLDRSREQADGPSADAAPARAPLPAPDHDRGR